MRKRNEAKPIQGWGWLGDAAEEAAVQAMSPARRSKNASAATAATKANRKSAAGRAGLSANDGGVATLTDDEYRRLAAQRYESEAKIEFDPHARVSRSEDRTGETGAWVQGWVFVLKPGGVASLR